MLIMQYKELVELYEKLESTTKRLEKTYLISEFLKKAKEEDLHELVLLLQGKLFPDWDDRKIGFSERLIIKAISTATGIDSAKVETEWKKTGDLGNVAENFIRNKKQHTLVRKDLTTKKVFTNLRKLTEMEGSGSVDQKIGLVAELLTSATPKEAKYIVRTVLEQLRVGVGEGALRDAIVWSEFPIVVGIFFKCKCGKWQANTRTCASCGKELKNKFNDEIKRFSGRALKVADFQDYKKHENELKKYDFVVAEDEKTARQVYNSFMEYAQHGYDLANDFGAVAEALRKKGVSGLDEVELEPGRPIKVMLAQKAADIEEAFETVGKPAELEFKYDGFRMQLHKNNNKVTLFTRRLENVTPQFPEVVEYVKEHVKGKSFILDSEVVGFDPETKMYLPFQNISQRIRRKYDIEGMIKTLPVVVNIFDCVFYEGKNMIKTPFKERRKLIEKIVDEKERKIVVAKKLVTADIKEANKFYSESLKMGNEGIMVKALDAPYKPGSRVGYMIKLKPVMESLDLVIVGAEWGEGKRATWLTSFTLACIDKNGKYLEVGKVGTGIKEKAGSGVTFNELTKLLKPLIKSEKGKYAEVRPDIVVEIEYNEIQKSPTYESGYALRFPRVIRLRNDRRADECSTIEMVKQFYNQQKKT